MSVSGLSSSSFGNQAIQNQIQQFQQEFTQLGQDLQSGNLSAAQSDFATLQANAPQGSNSTNSFPISSSTSSSQSSNPIAQAFNQLSSALQSGNLSAAQQDYSTIQSDFQSQLAQSESTPGRHHHHHASESSGSSSSSSSEQNGISELFTELGSALQSGNLSTAQQAYTTLQQDLQQYTQGNSSVPSTSAQSSSGRLSVNG